ncbi:MAG: hypothetical protein QXH07_06245 [Thermoplasmata archaeon]
MPGNRGHRFTTKEHKEAMKIAQSEMKAGKSKSEALRIGWSTVNKRRHKKKYDLPEPHDYHVQSNDIIIRLVPEIDNLFELAIYVDPITFKSITDILDKEQIHYDKIEDGYIARRGRKEKGTNIFIIES